MTDNCPVCGKVVDKHHTCVMRDDHVYHIACWRKYPYHAVWELVRELRREVGVLKSRENEVIGTRRDPADVRTIKSLCDLLTTVRVKIDKLMAWDNNILDSNKACDDYKKCVEDVLKLIPEIDLAICAYMPWQFPPGKVVMVNNENEARLVNALEAAHKKIAEQEDTIAILRKTVENNQAALDIYATKEIVNDDRYRLKAGDTVVFPHWGQGKREVEVIDFNCAINAVAVKLAPDGGIVVWPMTGVRKV